MAGIIWLLQRAFGKARKHNQKQIDNREKEKRKSLKKQAELNPSDAENIKNWAKYYGEKKQQADEKYKTERATRIKTARLKGPGLRKTERRKSSIYMAKDSTPKKKKIKEETMLKESVLKFLKSKMQAESSQIEAESQLPQDIQDYNAKIRDQEISIYTRQLLKAADLADASNPFEAARLRQLATEAMKKTKSKFAK